MTISENIDIRKYSNYASMTKVLNHIFRTSPTGHYRNQDIDHSIQNPKPKHTTEEVIETIKNYEIVTKLVNPRKIQHATTRMVTFTASFNTNTQESDIDAPK
jgi:hypothetical protein